MRLSLSAVVVLVCGVLGWVALAHATNDLTSMLPGGDSEVAREARFFSAQSTTHILALEAVPVDGHTQEDAQRVLTALLPRLEPLGVHQPSEGTPEGLARAATMVLERLPVLLTADELTALGPDLEDTALTQRMHALRERASQPDDALTATVARQDVLALGGGVLEHLRTGPGGARRDGPLFLHQDGRHVMTTLAVDFPPGDLDRSEPLITALAGESATAQAEGVQLRVIGPYRHYVENIATVRGDLWSTLPVELLLVAALLYSLLGSLRVVLAVHVPALCGMIGALAGVQVWSVITGHTLPLPLLGFAAGILGIAVDYASHMAAGARRGHVPKRALITAYVTTSTVFAVLLTSGSPALQCLSVMVLAGLGAALGAALVLMPVLLPTTRGADRWARLSVPLRRWIVATPRRHLLMAALLSAALLPGLARLGFESELKRFDGSTPEAWADLEAFLVRWGAPDSSTFIVATDRTLDTALSRVADARQRLGLKPGVVEQLLPSAAERRVRIDAWNAWWLSHGDVGQRIAQAASAAHLRPAAFAPSVARYLPVPAKDPGPLDWRGTPVDTMVGMLVVQTADGDWTVASGVEGADRHRAKELTRQLHGLGISSGVWIANRGEFGERIIASVKSELLGSGLYIALAVVLVVLLLERSWRRGLAILVPPALAVGWAFGVLGYLGMPLTPFSLLATAFVLGIGIDSAIFLAHEDEPAALSPVLNASFTTIAGFSAMAVADHPLIHGMGVTLAIGMTAVLITTVLITPALARGIRRG